MNPSLPLLRTPGRRFGWQWALLGPLLLAAPNARSAESGAEPSHGFGTFDWTVVVIYVIALVVIGLASSRKQHTTEEYFLASRSMRPFLVGISLFSALFSMISYIGTPGEYIQFGPILSVAVAVAIIPFVQIAVGRWFIPVVMSLPITSAYELLETRLGRSTRKLGSITYIVTRLIWMALILYTGSTILTSVTGCTPPQGQMFMVGVGLLTTLYTLFGGIRTVMITEVIQFCMMLLGALLTIVSITIKTGGVAAWWPTHWEAHWPKQPLFSFDPHVRVTIIGAFITYTIAYIASGTSDQASIQRFLTTRDAKAARRTFLLNNLANGVISVILGMVGAALITFFHRHPEAIPPGHTFQNSGDQFFPYYVSHFLPAGIAGLVVASLLSASMSCLSSGTNSVLTVIMTDFVGTTKAAAGRSEAKKLRITRWLALVIGLIAIGASLAMVYVKGDLFEVTNKTVNLLVCPVFGLFVLALFVKFSTPFGALMGTVYSVTTAILIGYWDVLTGAAPISFLFIMPFSLVVSVGAGCLFSLAPTRGRSPPVLVAWTAGALLLLLLLVCWLLRVAA